MARRLLALALVLWAAALARDRFDAWIGDTPLPPLELATATEVLAADGSLLRAYTVEDGRWRLAVSREAVDPMFIAMLVAWEDRRFDRHAGVDGLAVLRAGWQALRHGRVVSGASTLSMQVARLVDDGPAGRWAAKLRQARLAMALERRLGKTGILRLYLHRAPYGGNVEGVRAAALTWFGKPPARLTPAEAAVLVALPQAPEARRPDSNPAALRAARDRVLTRAETLGLIDAAAARSARAAPLPAARIPMPMLAPHLSDRAASAGGTVQRTTIDPALQRAAEALVTTHMAGRDSRMSMALVIADHRTGAIRALVGSASYGDTDGQGFVDMTQAVRSPGSTLKPLVYALAFDRGLAHPGTIIADTPAGFGRYAPQNFDGRFRGDVTVAEALAQSLNIPAVRLAEALGPAHLHAALADAGTPPHLPPGASAGLALALGGAGMTLTDLVQLYATLAQGGRVTPLHWDTDLAHAREHRRIVRDAAAWHVADILSGGDGAGMARPGAIAWKTGTSYGHRDAWAIGWDGTHVAGIWIGRPDGTPVPGAFGGDTALPALGAALALTGHDPLPPPPGDAILARGTALPAHLHRFGGNEPATALRIVFPPDGATLADAGPVPFRLQGGTPPFTLLADGAPVTTGLRSGTFTAALPGPGFTTLSVLDSAGHAARATIELR